MHLVRYSTLYVILDDFTGQVTQPTVSEDRIVNYVKANYTKLSSLKGNVKNVTKIIEIHTAARKPKIQRHWESHLAICSLHFVDIC